MFELNIIQVFAESLMQPVREQKTQIMSSYHYSISPFPLYTTDCTNIMALNGPAMLE